MNLLEILGIACGLAMDAAAVSIATSVALARVHWRQVFRFAFHFGLFQMLMPVAGWLLGMGFERLIASWDHWVAFILLAAIGGKAVCQALRGGEESMAQRDPTRGWSLVGLSVATSIDALAVGLSLGVLNVPIWCPVTVIGVITAALSALGMLLGSRIGLRFGKRMAIAGGLVLIAIGLKILADHVLLGGILM